MDYFSDTFLDTLGEWQRGWKENQALREDIAKKLELQAIKLPQKYRIVSAPCYRKRYLLPSDINPLFMDSEISDGATSWTLDKKYAEFFKGFWRDDAVTAVIFKHTPNPSEVILNIASLYESTNFMNAVNAYIQKSGKEAATFIKIGAQQKEVVLNTNLRVDEIIAFTGKSSPFDELCIAAGVNQYDQDSVWKFFVEIGMQPEVPRYVEKDGVKRILAKVLAKANELKKSKKQP